MFSKIKLLFYKIKIRIMKWFRRQLGLGYIVGVDLGVHGQTTIIIASRLEGGRMKIIDTEFKDKRELEVFIKQIQDRFDVKNWNIIKDMPRGLTP